VNYNLVTEKRDVRIRSMHNQITKYTKYTKMQPTSSSFIDPLDACVSSRTPKHLIKQDPLLYTYMLVDKYYADYKRFEYMMSDHTALLRVAYYRTYANCNPSSNL
jgi:hypothetical protein